MKTAFRFVFRTLSATLILWMGACAPASTPVVPAPSQANPPASEQTPEADSPMVADVETQTGFQVQEPGYLPPGVSLESAAFEAEPSPGVVLHFKLVHEQFGDMGPFFQVRQEPLTEAPPALASCGESTEDCEVLQVGDRHVMMQPNLFRSSSTSPPGPKSRPWWTGWRSS